MKAICKDCNTEKVIYKDGKCMGCSLKLPLAKAIKSITETITAASTINPKPTNKLTCEVCGTEKKVKADLQTFRSLRGTLECCADCFTKETNAALVNNEMTPDLAFDPSNYKTWPRCVSCNAHVREPIEGKCTPCNKKPVKAESPILLRPTDSNKYQEFFNRETASITEFLKQFPSEMEGMRALKSKIEEDSEAIYGLEADLLQKKSQKQAKLVKFNAILKQMSLDEQSKLRIEDGNFKIPVGTSPSKKMASPLKKLEKKKKVKSDLDQQINDMFGGKLTEEELEQKKKALGL